MSYPNFHWLQAGYWWIPFNEASAFLLLLLSSNSSQCLKPSKKSHFTTLRAKRAMFTLDILWYGTVGQHIEIQRRLDKMSRNYKCNSLEDKSTKIRCDRCQCKWTDVLWWNKFFTKMLTGLGTLIVLPALYYMMYFARIVLALLLLNYRTWHFFVVSSFFFFKLIDGIDAVAALSGLSLCRVFSKSIQIFQRLSFI